MTTTTDSPVRRVLDQLDRVRRAGEGFAAICPAHDDSSPSLSITEGDDGRALLHCHAGCHTDDILGAIGMTTTDLFAEPANGNGDRKREQVATYDYTDEHGDLLFQVVRFAPKDFRQRTPDGNGAWNWSTKGIRKPLYRLPEVLDAVAEGLIIYVCEGEKDVHAMEGFVATTCPGGAGKWRQEHTEALSGASHVIIVSDADAPGRAHAREVADALRPRVGHVEIVEPKIGKDAAEHLGAGYTVSGFVPICTEHSFTDEDTDDDSTEPSSWTPADLSAVGCGDPEPARYLRRTDGAALIYAGRTHWISGETESLKTWIALVIAKEVLADGGRVLFIDYEDNDTSFVERMIALGVAREVVDDPDRVRYVQPTEPVMDRQDRTTRGGVDLADLLAWKPDLVILDGVTESMEIEGLSAMDGGDVSAWLRRILRRFSSGGAASIALDHVTKSTETRGRYAIGSVHKANGIDGAAYTAEAIRPLARARREPVEALVRLSVAKDRRGFVRGLIPGGKGPAADIELTAYPDGGVSVVVGVPGKAGSGEHERRIAEHLRIYPGSPLNALRGLGNSDAIDAAIKTMVIAGNVVVEKVGTAHRHSLTEAGEDAYPEGAAS